MCADGLHLPERDLLSPQPLQRIWAKRRNRLLTASVHSIKSLKAIRDISPDAIIYSPIFPTDSHPGEFTKGNKSLASLIKQIDIPVIALGGLNEKSSKRLIGTRCAGIAAISGLM